MGGQPESRNKKQEIRLFWTFRDHNAMIDGIIHKERWRVIPKDLQKQATSQLHNNHVGIEKTEILVCESIYSIGMYADIENQMKSI